MQRLPARGLLLGRSLALLAFSARAGRRRFAATTLCAVEQGRAVPVRRCACIHRLHKGINTASQRQ